MREELVIKSKEQAVKLESLFKERYGEIEGSKKYQEVLNRSPQLDQLPDRIDKQPKLKKRKINVTTRFGRAWRGI